MQRKQSESSGTSKVESKKDKGCHMSRRRPQSYEPDCRSGISYPSLPQSATYPHNLSGANCIQFTPWYNRPTYHSQQNGGMYAYPGQQMFMQHRPFGSENNYFRPVRYPSQFSLPHSHFLDHPAGAFAEPRQNSFRYQADNGHFDEMLNGQNTRSYNNDYGQGARPKSSPFQNGKRKCYKKRKNHNNSSNISHGGEDGLRRDNIEFPELPQNSDSTAGNDPTKSCNSLNPLNCPSETVANVLHGHLADAEKENLQVRLDLSSSQGAVGGECCNVFKTAGNTVCSSVMSFDKNLIDEGAICDLDKMFQRQEFSHHARDSGDSFHFDDELDKESKVNSSYQNISDDDSEFENCSYVYDPKHSQSLDNSLPGLTSLIDIGKNLEDKRSLAAGAVGMLPNAESPEDTGDFIDTDLPAQRHLLSSSDEMDSHSSINSESDSEETKRCQSHKLLQDFNSNDLSSCECELPKKVETLSIGHESTKCGSLTSSHLKKPKDIHNKKVKCQARPKKLSANSYKSSSESDNDERTSPESPSKHYVHNSASQVCYNPAVACLDGAAASQLPVERPINMTDTLCNSCPPGAECEIAPQCFHSNLFCNGAQVCGQTKSGQGVRCRHNAFTASSQTDHGRGAHLVSNPESAGCSVTADGGVCCSLPVGYLLPVPVNDLNACCHHTHSHVANGFNEGDSPGANFNTDESNRLQKVFVKFSNEDKMDEGESHSASSCDLEDADGQKTEKHSDSGGSEDPLNHDNNDNVDMVLLPMEEEIEPVHHMSGGLCAGGVDDDDDLYQDISGQLATAGKIGNSLGYMCDDHQYLYAHDQNPLGNGMFPELSQKFKPICDYMCYAENPVYQKILSMSRTLFYLTFWYTELPGLKHLPSKEFYELIKTVSTTDSYMRFFDKDGQDVQRQPLVPCDDESKQTSTTGGPNSKTERLKVDRVMIWNEYEAYVMQFKQIAVSACGQTAVLNVLKALKFSCEKSAVCKVIQTSLRKEEACVPEYLFSRAKAGTTAEELMSGVEKLSSGAVGGRFFHFWPPRKIKLLQWLAYWMKRGAIPMATLNLQQGPHSLWQVPDSWHHQMVYGVSHQGLYLTNPLEIVSERSAMKQLSSDSVLMVRRQDIISRFRETTDLGQLLNHPDHRWRTMNVLGQVVNVLREFNMPSVPGYRLQVTSHVSIPASYKAGITLFMRKDKSAWTELLNAPEIPLE